MPRVNSAPSEHPNGAITDHSPMAASLSTTTPYGAVQIRAKLPVPPSVNYLSFQVPQKHNIFHKRPLRLTNHVAQSKWPPFTPSAISGETSAVEEGKIDLLDSVIVFDLNGNGIPISDLWKDRKAVVAFARHFGWVNIYSQALQNFAYC